MNALQKVTSYLQLQNITEVQEWAHVYWVRFSGRRPTMLSKKLVNRAAQLEFLSDANEPICRDKATGKIFILRKPCYGVTNWAIREIEAHQVSRFADFSHFKSEVSHAYFSASTKPASLRELMVRKAVMVG